ncbi:MAG: type II toxin-antitoxin system Phd/YefM family antitoxin [Dermatophilaceae bacterium]
MSVTASQARKQLFPLIEQVNNERITVEITSRRGNAVLISAEEFAAMRETAYLLRVPANAKRLLESLQQALSGDRQQHDLVE